MMFFSFLFMVIFEKVKIERFWRFFFSKFEELVLVFKFEKVGFV